MSAPVRLQLSRKRGFNLQAHSRAVNGLPAVNVARPSSWGNPFLVHPNHRPGRRWGLTYISVPTADDAVSAFAEMMEIDAAPGQRAYELRQRLTELRGRNLACWCKPGAPCHADVLLNLANAHPYERSPNEPPCPLHDG